MSNDTQAIAIPSASILPVCVPTAAIRAQIDAVRELMRGIMIDGVDYGTIPGCGDRKALRKSGAEKLCFGFRLAPEYSIQRDDLTGGHREYHVTCVLASIQAGTILGAGVGSATTMESKYRYRRGELACPICGKEAIIKSRPEYGGGWVCLAKKGGCGTRFPGDDQRITGQSPDRAENPDIADVYNTVLKMAKKRALVDAILTCLAASDIFASEEIVAGTATKMNRAETLKAVRAALAKLAKDQPTRQNIANQVWGVSSWEEIERLSLEQLQAGLTTLVTGEVETEGDHA